ncbi:MliC family protein [Pseudomonas jinjuensis]|uniref:Membrane-bound inhibitor of C-type lysozyme n=1 Tax=Pseudomonas jinjuensis TaxID=198616 RepID=A0A1H0AT54_9PSED|nr:MliC family protein [Pseudomonas jinjuensis]SDN36688.1 Membrane-bound inhibitor of C-type lysozyme [Pseudomonas jinjuensis]
MKKALWLLAAVPVFLVACGGEEPKSAAADALVLPGDAELDSRNVEYKCEDGRDITVQYLNKGDNRLAVVPVSDSSTLVFANVISGSGARYAAAQYIWWSKGAEATLYKEWMGGEPVNGVVCRER